MWTPVEKWRREQEVFRRKGRARRASRSEESGKPGGQRLARGAGATPPGARAAPPAPPMQGSPTPRPSLSFPPPSHLPLREELPSPPLQASRLPVPKTLASPGPRPPRRPAFLGVLSALTQHHEAEKQDHPMKWCITCRNLPDRDMQAHTCHFLFLSCVQYGGWGTAEITKVSLS